MVAGYNLVPIVGALYEIAQHKPSVLAVNRPFNRIGDPKAINEIDTSRRSAVAEICDRHALMGIPSDGPRLPRAKYLIDAKVIGCGGS